MRDADIVKIQKELSQVATAVRVVGTRRAKLHAMARLAQPIIQGLDAKRPEVVSVRQELHKAAQRVSTVRARAREASEALEALSAVLETVRGVLRKGYGSAKPNNVGPFVVVDRWGLTRQEFFRLLDILRSAYGILSDVGYRRLFDGATIVVDPTMLTGETIWYVPGAKNEFVVSPELSRERDVFFAVAEKAFLSVMNNAQRKVWARDGHSRGLRLFSNTFSDFLEGADLGDDEYERLETSLPTRG